MNADGELIYDFHIEKNDNIIHVLNVTSPVATACLLLLNRSEDQISF